MPTDTPSTGNPPTLCSNSSWYRSRMVFFALFDLFLYALSNNLRKSKKNKKSCISQCTTITTTTHNNNTRVPTLLIAQWLHHGSPCVSLNPPPACVQHLLHRIHFDVKYTADLLSHRPIICVNHEQFLRP